MTPSERLLSSRMDKLIEEHGSQRALALFLGVTEGYVSNVCHNRQSPSARLLKLLGLRRVRTLTITYEDATK